MKIVTIINLIFLELHFHPFVYGDLETKLKSILQGFVDEEKGSVPIDEDHLKSNPECGFLPKKIRNTPTSRISNAEESDQHYPWVTLISRENEYIEGGLGRICGGSIITPTVAVTASHCICGSTDPKIPQNLKRFTNCVGGYPIVMDNPPNEVRSRKSKEICFNEIKAGIGDKDINRQTQINIPVAYVMGTFTTFKPGSKRGSAGTTFDIGLVMTKDKSGKGSVFYKHTLYTMEILNQEPIRVGSLCLAAKKESEPYLYEGSVVGVGWGTRYSDVKTAANQPKANTHSCTTNEFGPSSATFRHCNVDDVLLLPYGAECKRQDMPNGYDAQKCEKYLEEAEKAIEIKFRNYDDSLKTTMYDIWKRTNKFEILPFVKISGIELTGIRHMCYKQKLFDDHGWCYVDANTNEWGFCGSSCEFLNIQNPSDTLPATYHKMIWEYPPRPNIQSRCDPTYHSPANFKPWYICVEPLAPQVSVFQFRRIEYNRLEFINPSKEDPVRAGYQLFCKGDSGSGNWMINSNENKRALVAVHSYDYGQFCGESSHAMSTVHPEVLDWIKRHSKIG